MNSTSSHLPICVHCGTPRPADETLCPTCGKPWIDTTITEAPGQSAAPVPPVVPAAAEAPDEDTDEVTTDDAVAGAVVAAGVAATAVGAGAANRDDEGQENEEDLDEQDDANAPDDSVGSVGAGAGATGAVAGSGDSDGEPAEPADTATSETIGDTVAVVPPPPLPAFDPDDTGEFEFDAWSKPPAEDEKRSTAWLVPAGIGVAILLALGFLIFGGKDTPTTTTVAAVETTVAPASTTTTSAQTTTSTVASTTTAPVVVPQPGDWPAKGTPIDPADLELKQDSIGPINIGEPIGDVAGLLTASLGEATEASVDGLCPPKEAYSLRFGQLTAIFDGFENTATFVSYRYDEAQGSDPDLGLKTLSGIAIGDTVEDLINTYTQFTISFEIIDSQDFFRLSDGGDLLLWGPVSSADPAGLVQGIYSPSACDS